MISFQKSSSMVCYIDTTRRYAIYSTLFNDIIRMQYIYRGDIVTLVDTEFLDGADKKFKNTEHTVLLRSALAADN